MTTLITANNIQPATLAVLDGPAVTNIQVTNSSYTVLDDTAVMLTGGYIKITGSNFSAGCTVVIGTVSATSVTFVNSTTLNVQVPAATAGTYIVYVINSDGAVAIRVNGLTYSSEPTWVTGSTLAGDSGTAVSIQLSATGASVYTLQAGSTLPANLTLTSGGLISGTVTVANETLYNFTVIATDAELQDSPRAFSITITVGDPFFNSTTLLLPGSANTFIKDSSTNNFPVTVVGDTKPNNFNPYLTGWSNFFDGTGDYLTLPATGIFDFGTGDFTVEAWIYPTASGSWMQIAGSAYSATGGALYVSPTLGLAYYTSVQGTPTAANSIRLNVWQHVAAVRTSGTVQLYINGIQGSSAAMTNNFTTLGGTIATRTSTLNSELFTGFISNVRAVRSAVYTGTTFTPPTQPLTAIAGTSLLTCADNRFIDDSTNNSAITRVGDVKIQSFSPFVEPITTRGSAYFDGAGDSIQVGSSNTGVTFGTADFTMEAWIYWNSLSSESAIMFGNGIGWTFYVFPANKLQWGRTSPQTPANLLTGNTTLNTGTWYHIAVTRASGTVTLWVNGVSDGTVADSANYSASGDLRVGISHGGLFFNGYMSNVRVVKGTAVYTANFTPPITPLTAVTNTSLLTLQNNTPQTNNQFLDSSSNNLLVTRAGNTTQGTFSPYSPSGWSNHFSANTAYLTVASNAAFAFPGEFTVEGWFNWSTLPSAGQALGVLAAGGFNFTYGSGSLSFNNFGSGNIATATYTFVVGVWYHIAMTRNVSNTCTIWINGVSSATGTSAVSFVQGTWSIYGGSNNGGAGYASNLRVVKGTAVYTANFTPSTQPLTAIAGTSLLTCADNRFIDDSPNNFAVARTGDVRVQNFSPFKAVTQTPTTYSAYFDGSGDYLQTSSSSAFAFGTGNFTVEFWLYKTTEASHRLVDFSNQRLIYIDGNGLLVYYVNTAVITGGTIPANTWTHVALSRSSGTSRMFINGVQTGSNYTDASNYTASAVFIGTDAGTQSVFGQCYISNLRVVNGTSLYASAFTPPTGPLTAIANTSFLTCQSATFVDNSTNRVAITVFGNSRPSMVNPFGSAFANSTGYTAVEYGGSMSFDGTGDYLEMPANTIFDFGANNFTMECWVFPLTTGVLTGFISNWQTGGQFIFRKTTANRPQFVYDPVSVAAVTITGTTTTIVTGMWNHVAVVRNGSLYTLYVNGVADATTSTSTVALEVLGKPLRVGVDGDAAGPMNGYISDVRIIKGQALYTSNFVPPLAPVLPVANTILLLNGTSAAITDATTKNDLETVGDARISTVQSKFGGSSMFFDGTGDHLTIPNSPLLNLSSGNWTIEAWVYQTVNTAGAVIVQKDGVINSSYAQYALGCNAGGKFAVTVGSGNGIAYIQSIAATSFNNVINTWYHLAAVKSGTTITLYIDGINRASATQTGTMVDGGKVVMVGYETGQPAANYWNGYIQDLRITQGTARYTANFTPPATAFQTK